jgi:hypothetical protein
MAAKERKSGEGKPNPRSIGCSRSALAQAISRKTAKEAEKNKPPSRSFTRHHFTSWCHKITGTKSSWGFPPLFAFFGQGFEPGRGRKNTKRCEKRLREVQPQRFPGRRSRNQQPAAV